jgi:hypothetical protein
MFFSYELMQPKTLFAWVICVLEFPNVISLQVKKKKSDFYWIECIESLQE